MTQPADAIRRLDPADIGGRMLIAVVNNHGVIMTPANTVVHFGACCRWTWFDDDENFVAIDATKWNNDEAVYAFAREAVDAMHTWLKRLID